MDRTVRLLTTHPGIRQQLQRQRPFLLVDEFQDSNKAQVRGVLQQAARTAATAATSGKKAGIRSSAVQSQQRNSLARSVASLVSLTLLRSTAVQPALGVLTKATSALTRVTSRYQQSPARLVEGGGGVRDPSLPLPPLPSPCSPWASNCVLRFVTGVVLYVCSVSATECGSQAAACMQASHSHTQTVGRGPCRTTLTVWAEGMLHA